MKRLGRSTSLLFLALLAAGFAVGQSSHTVSERSGVSRRIEVPLDHFNPSLGSFTLMFELGKPYDPKKPTVLVVADAQQFYVRPGMITPLQDELFGDSFNVVGIIGRGTNSTLSGMVVKSGRIDWKSGYQLFRWEQWAEDIDAVRKAVVGDEAKVSLYGRSGGALLVDQYLSLHPNHVGTVFTQAAVNPYLGAEFQLNADHFWGEIGAFDPTLQADLLKVLAQHPEDRARIVLLLQRQNFFVSADNIMQARAELIHALARWDTSAIAGYARDYQVNEILKMQQSATNTAVAVRLFEFIAPLTKFQDDNAVPAALRVDPDTEVLRTSALPLLDLLKARQISLPSMNFSAPSRVDAKVFMLAGYYDHVADYRVQLALSSCFPSHALLLLADDHDFLALQKTGLYSKLVRTALLFGVGSNELRGVESELKPLIYSEFAASGKPG